MAKAYAPISFADKFALFSEQWEPKVVAEMNDYHFACLQAHGAVFEVDAQLALENDVGLGVLVFLVPYRVLRTSRMRSVK